MQLSPYLAGLDLGIERINFPNSGSADAQEAFLKGLILLHCFEYDDAAEAFRVAQSIDPDFAMAYWGEAMTCNRTIWFEFDGETGRKALHRLAGTPAQRQRKAGTEKEKGYLQAIDILFGEGEKKARDVAYREAMRRLHERYPDDLEIASFYAVSILGTSHEGRDNRLYEQAAAIARQALAKDPKHLGALHYLIHACDDPEHAHQALEAAHTMAAVAPPVPHVLHMPSHIFLALGMWEEVILSNEDSMRAGDRRVEVKKLGAENREYHSIWWLQYAALQIRDFARARHLLGLVEGYARQSSEMLVRNHLNAMRNAYLIDSGDWQSDAAEITIAVDDLPIESSHTYLFVNAWAALRRGQRERCRALYEQMRREHARFAAGKWPEKIQNEWNKNIISEGSPVALILEKELEALLYLDAGTPDDAAGVLREAARLEEKLHFMYGPPEVAKPSHELLGEILLQLNRPDEARKAFDKVLQRAPGRRLSLEGVKRSL